MVEVTGGRQRPAPKASPRANPQAASPAVPRAARTGPGLTRPLEERARGRFVFTLFFACLLIPAKFDIGTLAMTPDRMLMLILFVPLTIRLLTGRLGRIGAVDVFILLYAAWVFLSLMVWHGASRLQFAGMTVVEMVGGYLFGRAMIRSEADYRAFFRQFYHALLFLLPFALIELFTARLLINDLVGKVFGTFPDAYDEPRWGLNRVQAVFQHPILFGLVCSLAIANFYFLNRARARPGDVPDRVRPLHDLHVAVGRAAAVGDDPVRHDLLGEDHQGQLEAPRHPRGHRLRHDRPALEPLARRGPRELRHVRCRAPPTTASSSGASASRTSSTFRSSGSA